MISLVIPVYNEADSLTQLHQEIAAVALQLSEPIEIIFVDDGSTDGSWAKILELADRDGRIAGIRFRRNFGKAAALAAGFRQAVGDRLMTLDADLQDDPKEIPQFLAKLDEGHDVVSGWKKTRHDPLHKTIPSWFFNQMVSRLTGVHLHDHNCGFKCYRKEVLDEIELYAEFHRFTPVLAAARGFKIGELVVQHRPRSFGRSKYGWSRIPRGFLDLLTVKFLTAFRNRPQHLLGSFGLTCIAIGLFGLSWLTGEWILTRLGRGNFLPLHQRPLLLFASTTLLLGVQLLSIGLLAELIIARNLSEHHVYSVAERRSRST